MTSTPVKSDCKDLADRTKLSHGIDKNNFLVIDLRSLVINYIVRYPQGQFPARLRIDIHVTVGVKRHMRTSRH